MKNLVLLIFVLASCSVPQTTKSVNPFTGGAVGCGNFAVYKLSEDGRQYISVVMNAGSLDLKEWQTFSIEKKPDLLEVKWKKYDADMSGILCNDIAGRRPGEIAELVAQSGTVNVKIRPVELEKAEKKEAYKATVTLRKVVFEGSTVDYLQIENITIGWLPG